MTRARRLVAIVLAATTLAAATPTAAREREDPPARQRQREPGDVMVGVGVGVLVAGIAAYGLLAAGLGLGARAEQDVAALGRAEDLERRREVMDRGRLGNRLAIAGGVIAGVAMAVGIPLVVVGRRRHQRAVQTRVSLHPGAGGATLRVRF